MPTRHTFGSTVVFGAHPHGGQDLRLSRVLAASAIALLCACSTLPPTVSPASPNPGESHVASPLLTPTAVPGTVRHCGAGDVGVGRVSWQGATATMAGGFELFATGSEACSVGGRVVVELRDAEGVPLPIQVHQMPVVAPPVILLPNLGTPRPDDAPVVGRADVLIYWSNWCGASFTGSGTLRASIPDVGVIDASFGPLSAPRCDAPGSPSVIDIGPVVPQDPNA